MRFFCTQKQDVRRIARRSCCCFCSYTGPKGRRVWVYEIIRKRQEHGEFLRPIQELRLDQQRFVQYFRITPEVFDVLLHIVGPHIRRQPTIIDSPCVDPERRLAICLRYFVMIYNF